MIKCDIIKDLFASYMDGKACNDTRTMVDGHIENCEDCANALISEKEKINAQLEENITIRSNIHKRMKAKALKKSLIISAIVSAMLLLIGVGGNWFVFRRLTHVPYEEGMFRIEETTWEAIHSVSGTTRTVPVVQIYANAVFSNGSAHFQVVEIDGVLTEIVFIHYERTLAGRFAHNYNTRRQYFPFRSAFSFEGRYIMDWRGSFSGGGHSFDLDAPIPLRIYYLSASRRQRRTMNYEELRPHATLLWSGILE